MTAAQATDEQLVAAYVAGDRDAFDALVERYSHRVYGICYRYFGNAHDAEDAAQDAFVLLLRRAETFSGASKFSTWMYRVATNSCNDLARKQARRPRTVTFPEEGEDRLSYHDQASTDDLIANRELALELTDALRALDADQREAVVLHDLYGVPYAHIAGRAGVAVGTVKSRIHRGHARLAQLLADRAAAQQPGTLAPDPTSNRRP